MSAPATPPDRLPAVTVAVIDDHPTTRAGTTLLLTEAGHQVIAEATTLAGAGQILSNAPPAVLVLDLNLPDGHALRHLPELRKLAPAVAILVLSAQDDLPVVRAVLQAGAAGYLLKDAPAAELSAAVAEVAAGGHYLQPQLAARLTRAAPTGPGLTEREETALRLWAQGHTNVQVAQALVVSVRTLENIRADLRTRLGLTDRAQIATYARIHLAPNRCRDQFDW